MRRTKFKDTVIREDRKTDGKNKYTYKLIMREDTRVVSYKIPLYSIRAEMTNENGETTHADINDVFADLKFALSFYEKIVRGLATPIDLRYVIEDEIMK